MRLQSWKISALKTASWSRRSSIRILPVLTYKTLDEAIASINARPHPLALYLFTSDRQAARKVTARCGFGGACINDTIIHLATSEMGFGGFGESGMGAYHGKTGFDTFSHYKSIVDKKPGWICPCGISLIGESTIG